MARCLVVGGKMVSGIVHNNALLGVRSRKVKNRTLRMAHKLIAGAKSREESRLKMSYKVAAAGIHRTGVNIDIMFPDRCLYHKHPVISLPRY